MGLKRLYYDIYRRFLENRSAHKGYDFQEMPPGSQPPPMVPFKDRLRWWTLNRPGRLRKIIEARDRQQQDILALKNPPPHK